MASFYRVGMSTAKGVSRAGNKLNARALVNTTKGATRSGRTAGKAGNIQRGIGAVQSDIGNGLNGVAGAMRNHPESSGVLATAGVGAAGYVGAKKVKGKIQQKRKYTKITVAKSAFGVEDIEKFDHGPKVKWTDQAVHEMGPQGSKFHGPTEATTSYKGKSMVLRRPKYQVYTKPDGNTKLHQGSRYLAEVSHRKLKKPANRQAVADAYEKKSKTLKTTFGSYKHQVAKSAFGIDHG